MKIGFLVKGEEAKTNLEQVECPDSVSVSVHPYQSGEDLYCISFELKGDSIDAAKCLADLRDSIPDVDCRLLDDDPSERFERDLYKQICAFERQLRKLLTLCLCSSDSLDNDTVARLEHLDFGELFERLFVDENFVKNAKAQVNGAGKPEKQDLLALISSLEEKTTWGSLFSEEELQTVAKRHTDIRLLRNDVMHSHRMGHQQYKNGMNLVSKANSELLDAINKRVQQPLPSKPASIEELALALNAFGDMAKITQDWVKALGLLTSLGTALRSSLDGRDWEASLQSLSELVVLLSGVSVPRKTDALQSEDSHLYLDSDADDKDDDPQDNGDV